MLEKNRESKKECLSFLGFLFVIAICTFAQKSPAEGLSLVGFRALLIFFGAVILLIFRPLPMMISTILAMTCMAIFGVFESLSDAWASLNNSTLVTILCMISMAVGLSKTSVPARLAFLAIRLSRSQSKALIILLTSAAVILSSIMTSLATCSCFLSLMQEILTAQKSKGGKGYKNLAKCLMIGLPMACGIGGSASPFGNSGNLVALSIVEEQIQTTIPFGSWVLISLPIALITMAIACVILMLVYPPEPLADISATQGREEMHQPDPLNRNDKTAIVILVGCIILWVASSWVDSLSIQMVGLLGAVLMLMPGIRLCTMRDIEKDMPWDTVFMILFSLGIVNGLKQSGAFQWIMDSCLVGLVGMPTILMVFCMLLFGGMLHALIPSGAALCAFLSLPYTMLLLSAGGVNPVMAAMISSYAASFNMILPVDALGQISLRSGYFTVGDFFRNGIISIFVLSAVAAILLVLYSNIVIPMV